MRPLQLVALLSIAIAQSPRAATPPLADPARAAQIGPALPQKPAGPGRPIADRAAWASFASQTARDEIVQYAESISKTPLPETTDDLFLDFSKTGNRTRWQGVAGKRRGRLPRLVLAECIENKGRFLPAFHELARSLCAERTWTMPAHDRKLENFYAKSVSIDLASSDVAWQFATALYLLGDRVEPDVRALIRSRIDAWVLNPARDGITGKGREQGWMRATHNWNAVCTAGVTGAALALVEPREDRALFAAAAEASTRFFLSGFTPDGYCSEGMGYWNYGFGHFLLLAETLSQATSGKLNLLDMPGAQEPARFPVNIHIQDGVYPAFADCAVGSRPSAAYMYFINRYFQAGWPQYNNLDDAGATGGLPENLLFGFPNSASNKPAPPPKPNDGIRSWFKDAGILIARPMPGSASRLAVALKGGNNAEHHNHNDLGSYVAVLGHEAIILDPGGEVYTARTFSKDRYTSKVLSSYGHPVPVVGGRLQRTGREAQAKVLESKFSDSTDTLALDLTSAYDTPGLKRLVRTFVYSRSGDGRLTVRDDVVLEKPATFETALITLDTWQQLAPKTLLIRGSRTALGAEIDAGGKAFAVVGEEIKEDVHTRNLPQRIAVRFTQPVTQATITITLSPLPRSALGPQPANGDFEQASSGWQLDGKMSTITEAFKASGKRSLRITDTSKKDGSSASSPPALLSNPGRHEVRGHYLNLSGKGIGVYVRYLDEQDHPIKTESDRHPIGVLGDGQPTQAWKPFAFAFVPPKGTDAATVWLHSISSATVDGCIDDIQVVPSPPPVPNPSSKPIGPTPRTATAP
ncbi:MAG TPA: heparinase II/III family protein [Verrucomicrobiae bacterium]|nr:heparinase II/III family protein [Verrucomicrobiae bacterium]